MSSDRPVGSHGLRAIRHWLEAHRRLVRLLSLVIGCALFALFLLYMSQEFRSSQYDLGLLLKQIRWQSLLIMLLLYLVALALAIWVWGGMVNQLAGPVGWSHHWYIYTTTSVTRRLPGSFWHVAGRAVLYHRRGIGRRRIALVSALEVALMMISGALVTLLLWPVALPEMEHRWQLALLVGGLLAGLAVLAHPSTWARVREIARGVNDHGATFTRHQGLTWLLAYGLVWILGGAMVALLANELYPLAATTWPAVVGAWALSSLLGLLIMILPSGLGIMEISLTALLSLFMPAPLAALTAIGSRALFTGFELLFALVFWLIGQFQRE